MAHFEKNLQQIETHPSNIKKMFVEESMSTQNTNILQEVIMIIIN